MFTMSWVTLLVVVTASSRRRLRSGSAPSSRRSCRASVIDHEAECAEGANEEITSSATCFDAANSLHIVWGEKENDATVPKGCYETNVIGVGSRAFYNSHPVGNSDPDWQCDGEGYTKIVCIEPKQPPSAGEAVLGTILGLLCCCIIPIGLCGYCFYKTKNQTQVPPVAVQVQAAKNPVPANDGPSVIVGKGEETKAMNTETTVAPAALRNAAHSEIVRL